MDKAYVRSVYRRFYRASQAAVRHRGPQKYIIRDHLRHLFRTGTSMPSPTELANTEEFLWTAGRRRGIENNIVSSMMNMQWARLYAARGPPPDSRFESLETFYENYLRCVDMLNKTAGLCLR